MNFVLFLKEASLTGYIGEKKKGPNQIQRGELCLFLWWWGGFFLVMVTCACASGHLDTYNQAS